MARITSMKYITFLFLCTLVLFSKYVVMGLKHDAKSISKNSNVVSINSNNKNNNNNKNKRTPWMEHAQAYPELNASDAILPGDVAAAGDPEQKYDNPLKPPPWMMLKGMEPPGLPETPPPPPPEQPAPLATPDFSSWGGAGWNGYMPKTLNNGGSLNPSVHLLAQGPQQRYRIGVTPTSTLNSYYGSLIEMSNRRKKNRLLRGN